MHPKTLEKTGTYRYVMKLTASSRIKFAFVSDSITQGLQVVFNVGLCIALFDLISVGDEYIFPSDGGSHIQVEFRLMVFRPFVGEVLTGKIRSCNQHGIMGSFRCFSFFPCSFCSVARVFRRCYHPVGALEEWNSFQHARAGLDLAF